MSNDSKDIIIKVLKEKIKTKNKEIRILRKLCEIKDSHFLQMISDGLRHSSKLASKHMKDRKDYINGKYWVSDMIGILFCVFSRD